MPVSIPDFPSLYAMLSPTEDTVKWYNVSPEVVDRFKKEIQILIDCNVSDEIFNACMDEFDQITVK